MVGFHLEFAVEFWWSPIMGSRMNYWRVSGALRKLFNLLFRMRNNSSDSEFGWKRDTSKRFDAVPQLPEVRKRQS